jgi:hypothetical protein
MGLVLKPYRPPANHVFPGFSPTHKALAEQGPGIQENLRFGIQKSNKIFREQKLEALVPRSEAGTTSRLSILALEMG